MRSLLVIALLMGIVPDAVETVEAGVHLIVSGHVAHWEPGETDLGDVGSEHGCGPLDHHCACCITQPALTSSVTTSEGRLESLGQLKLRAKDTGVEMASLPFRPPIAA